MNMIIDRHNYEPFFLLYADRELDAPTAAAVEAFAAAHPDLQQELQLLLQTRFNSTQQLNSSFKTSLLREVPETETYETLLLHLDNELDSTAAAALEKELRNNSQLQHQWTLLQKTGLQPDTTIQYPDKENLYRYNTPVHTLWQPWAKRLAAAAAIALLVLSAWWLVQPGNDTQHNLAGSKVIEPVMAPATNNSTLLPAVAENPTATNTLTETPGNHAIAIKNSKQTDAASAVTLQVANKPADKYTAGNTLPVVAAINVTEPQDDTETLAATTAPEKISATGSNITSTSNVPSVAGTTNTDIAYYNGNTTNAIMDEADAESGLLSDALQRRSGLTGFLKKARRTIERRTGIVTGDGQLRFAVFAVNTQ